MRANVRTAANIFRSHDSLGLISEVKYLRDGYSKDRKYIAAIDNQPRYLLRISDISELPRRTTDYEQVGHLHACGIACPKPIHLGVSEPKGYCYTIHDYIPGECAETAIPSLPPVAQYRVGLAAGQELRKVHEAIKPQVKVDWREVRSSKYRVYQRHAQEMELTYDGQSDIEDYIEANLALMQGRPTAFLHGDFHPGNLIIHGDKLAGIIDFNRCHWGDPYFEFYKLAQFGAPLSKGFARGQIDGYFAGEVPQDFWPLYNLYVAMVLTVDMVWTQHYFPQQMARARRLNRLIMAQHDFTSSAPPAWYTH